MLMTHHTTENWNTYTQTEDIEMDSCPLCDWALKDNKPLVSLRGALIS